MGPIFKTNLFLGVLKTMISMSTKHRFRIMDKKIYSGSYMGAHVLLNLLMLGKRDKMRGLLTILSLFRNKFSKFNNTRAQMLDSI